MSEEPNEKAVSAGRGASISLAASPQRPNTRQENYLAASGPGWLAGTLAPRARRGAVAVYRQPPRTRAGIATPQEQSLNAHGNAEGAGQIVTVTSSALAKTALTE